MHTRLFTALAIALSATIGSQAHASSDDSCYPTWSLLKEHLDVCSNLSFLSPGNDSSVNLRLLLANAKDHGLTPAALTEDDLAEGYGEVPFAHYRLQSAAEKNEENTSGSPDTLGLNEMLATLGVKREPAQVAGDTLLDGEGSRCRSNNETTATHFIQTLINTPQLAPAERAALATSRMQMLSACGWEPEQLTSLLPGNIQSVAGKSFVNYLQAAADFYSGRFIEASKGFTLLADNPQEWLKDTALYMIGRTELNLAQEKAFEYGELKPDRVDLAATRRAESAFKNYVDNYPFGTYSNTARGLLRRVHWLTQDNNQLAADYEAHLLGEDSQSAGPADEALIRESDLKLITPNKAPVNSPIIAAVNDLMWMREGSSNALTKAALLTQKDTFAGHPQLFTYLQAAFALYVENDPDGALKLLPTDIPDTLGYLAFSQQMLRGLALEASQDWKQAQTLWLQLLPLAKLPLQNEQLQQALAMSYERDEQLAKVFAADSPIKAAKLRYILLSKTADADLLIQQTTHGVSETERNTALFVLLYKDLMRSQFARFGEDLKRLPDAPSPEKLGYSLGYVHNQGPSLSLFRWKGNEADSGYACPGIAEIAAVLAKDAISPRGLNCMGEFIRSNHLDGMPLDEKRNPDVLGGTPPGYVKRVFARHTAYQAVIVNPKAGHEDKAYALYRAINCYAPSGNNSCGGKAVVPAERQVWFKKLKSEFADTPWSKSLQYYW